MRLKSSIATFMGLGIGFAFAVATYATDKNARCLTTANYCDALANAFVSQTPCPKTPEGDRCKQTKCIKCDKTSQPEEIFNYCIVLDDATSKCDHGGTIACGKQKQFDCEAFESRCRCPTTMGHSGGTPLPNNPDCSIVQCTPPA